MAYPKN